MKRKKDNLRFTGREAMAAGLSYGQYIAREYTKRNQRKMLPKDYISINDRKRLGISTPIYCGKTTIEAALPLDCPRRTAAKCGRRDPARVDAITSKGHREGKI